MVDSDDGEAYPWPGSSSKHPGPVASQADYDTLVMRVATAETALKKAEAEIARLSKENWQLRRVEEADRYAMKSVVDDISTHGPMMRHRVLRLEYRLTDSDRTSVYGSKYAPIMFRVEENDDDQITCFLCGGGDHLLRELCVSYHTIRGRVTSGMHENCYERAKTPVTKATK